MKAAKKVPPLLTRQLVIRVDDVLYADLVEKANASERTVAQEVRFRLRQFVKTAPRPRVGRSGK